MDNITMSKQINGIVEANFLKDIEDARKFIEEMPICFNGMIFVCPTCGEAFNTSGGDLPCKCLVEMFKKGNKVVCDEPEILFV